MQIYNLVYNQSINNYYKCRSFVKFKILSKKLTVHNETQKTSLISKYVRLAAYCILVRKKLRLFNKRKYFKKKIVTRRIGMIINLLKIPSKFQFQIFKFFNYCRVYFKFTGSNMFLTITNNIGDVKFSYSAGIFKGIDTRREKTTVFISRQLGQVAAVRLYQSNARSITLIPLINHRRTRVLLRYLLKGFRFIRFVKIKHIFMRVKILRNGIRLKKIPRK